jgi:hypothetical protein
MAGLAANISLLYIVLTLPIHDNCRHMRTALKDLSPYQTGDQYTDVIHFCYFTMSYGFQLYNRLIVLRDL